MSHQNGVVATGCTKMFLKWSAKQILKRHPKSFQSASVNRRHMQLRVGCPKNRGNRDAGFDGVKSQRRSALNLEVNTFGHRDAPLGGRCSLLLWALFGYSP